MRHLKKGKIIMQEITGDSVVKSGSKIMLKCVAAVVMCFIVFASMFLLCSYIFTNDIGYDVYVYNEEKEEFVLEYTYYYSDGAVDERLEELDNNEAVYRKLQVRSELEGFGYYLTVVITQLFSLIILFSLLYIDMWKIGDKERNLSEFGHIQADNLKGLKIGLFASIPFFLFYVLLILCKLGILPDGYYSAYRILNSHVFVLLTELLGAQPTLETTGWINLIASSLLLFIIPLMCHIGFYLGYKGILIKEKLIYKS